MIFSNNIFAKFQKVFTILQQKNISISTAESCTGGLLSALFTELDGSSKIFDRGFITYSNQSKISLLEVNEELLKNHGAVSQEVAIAMAIGALKKSQSKIAIATTGIAGPQGGTLQKPVGTVYIAIASTEKSICQKFYFGNDRQLNRWKTVEEAINLLEIFLKEI